MDPGFLLVGLTLLAALAIAWLVSRPGRAPLEVPRPSRAEVASLDPATLPDAPRAALERINAAQAELGGRGDPSVAAWAAEVAVLALEMARLEAVLLEHRSDSGPSVMRPGAQDRALGEDLNRLASRHRTLGAALSGAALALESGADPGGLEAITHGLRLL